MICENNIYIKSKNDPVWPVLLLLGTNHYFSGGGDEKFTGTNSFFFSATSTQTIFLSGNGFANNFFSIFLNTMLYFEEFYVATLVLPLTE